MTITDEKPFKIGKFEAKELSPYIIAEIGVNHGGSIDLAKQQIEQAKKAGAHAAKFQTYKAETIASKHSPAYWDTKAEPTTSQYALFKKYDSFEEKEYIELARFCSDLDIDFMSTPFDLKAVEFLAPLVPAFKIASADITNIPLLRAVSRTEKPIILSTGASTLPEISHAIETCVNAGAESLALLHCVLNYPTPLENANLKNILTLKRTYPEYHIGYSDHVKADETLSALEMATLIGATILEKHFTHDKSLTGNDHYHAMDQHDLTRFVQKLDTYNKLAGEEFRTTSKELSARKHARRSIFTARPIAKGEIFSDSNLIAKRPGHGMSPIHWDEVIGKVAAKDIPEDALIGWNDVK